MEKKRESGVNYGKRVASLAKNKGGIYFGVGFFFKLGDVFFLSVWDRLILLKLKIFF